MVNQQEQVALIEIHGFRPTLLPLLSSSLHAYARKDPEINRHFQFTYVTEAIDLTAKELLLLLLLQKASVYAFSCYVWNSGLIRHVLLQLVAARPDALFLLGGDQAAHNLKQICPLPLENVLVCNGQGEGTFRQVLRHRMEGNSDWSQVDGISFYRDGEVVTTAPAAFVPMEDIPSPYAEGLIKVEGNFILPLETNRGCPYTCTFCSGWVTHNRRVYEFPEERVYADIEMIAKGGAPHLFIFDSNWGSKRKHLDYTRFICECKKKYGAPGGFYANYGRAHHDWLLEIADMLYEHELNKSFQISLQSVNPATLHAINRRNVDREALHDLRSKLNTRAYSDFVELIWPLPKETLDTFQEGIQELVEMGMEVLTPYPLISLHNTELDKKAAEHGNVLVPGYGDENDAVVVRATNEVTPEEYLDGLWFGIATLRLVTLRHMRLAVQYLNESRIRLARDVIQDFADFSREHLEYPFNGTYRDAVAENSHWTSIHWGVMLFRMHHQDRALYLKSLVDFARGTDYFDERAEILMEVDLLHFAVMFSNTDFSIDPSLLNHFRVVECSLEQGTLTVEPTAQASKIMREVGHVDQTAKRWVVSYPLGIRPPYTSTETLPELTMKVIGLVQGIVDIAPTWTPAS